MMMRPTTMPIFIGVAGFATFLFITFMNVTEETSTSERKVSVLQRRGIEPTENITIIGVPHNDLAGITYHLDANDTIEQLDEAALRQKPTTAPSILTMNEDPFAAGDDNTIVPKAMEHVPTGSQPTVDPALAQQFKGIEILLEMGYPIPTLSFTYDDSETAKKSRMVTSIELFRKSEGLPAEVAKLKAQLSERELQTKATRAKHAQKRAIVRLIQEAHLKKDAADRDQRMSMLQLKQDMAKKSMEEAQKQMEEQRSMQEKERQEREEKARKEREDTEKMKDMMNKLRIQDLEKTQKENEERRTQEREEKRKEAAEREKRLAAERESKRKMIEELQSAMQAQLENEAHTL